MPEPEAKPLRWWRIEHYKDSDGRMLIVRVPPENGASREYLGQVMVVARHPSGAEISQPFVFRIEADSVREAFEKFAATGKAAFDAERTKVRLLVPHGAAAHPKGALA